MAAFYKKGTRALPQETGMAELTQIA